MSSFDKLLIKELPLLMEEEEGIVYSLYTPTEIITQLIGGPFDGYWVLLPYHVLGSKITRGRLVVYGGGGAMSVAFLKDDRIYSPLYASDYSLDSLCECIRTVATCDIPELKMSTSIVDSLVLEPHDVSRVAVYEIHDEWLNADGNAFGTPFVDPNNPHHLRYNDFCYCEITFRLL